MSDIVNAEIKSTVLGIEDHGIMSCWLFLEWEGAGCGFGGYALDGYDEKQKRRIDSMGITGEYIKEVMRVVGVEKWEDLKGKYIRVDTEGWGGGVLGIGNLLKEKWFYPKQWLKHYFPEDEDE